MANQNLQKAKNAKNDEFYTQYQDIQKEVNAYLEYDINIFRDKTVLLPCDDPEWSNFTKFFAQNFNNFGLKKLISTSYAYESKIEKYGQLDLFEDSDYITNDTNFNCLIDKKRGKIFTITRKNKNVDINDLKWKYLEGDGDFRSDEVKKLRDEADFIITNPPFSLFREFIKWLFENQDKKFLIIGNMNAITYKEVFDLIKNNRIWLGNRFNQRVNGKNMTFGVPKNYPMNGTELYTDSNGNKYISVAGTGWYTNIDHGRRHEPLKLMTTKDNLKFNKKLKDPKYQSLVYKPYDNYNAIEISFTGAIPSDYKGIMGVPISFLSKYCPEQFDIIGADFEVKDGLLPSLIKNNWNGKLDRAYINGVRLYSRLLIKHKNSTLSSNNDMLDD